MTETASLQHSVATMGILELALALFALVCYCLMLNGSLGAKARTIAGACAALAAVGLAALADPWMNGVILIAIGVAGIGAFVIAAWGISALCGFTGRPATLAVVEDSLPEKDSLPQTVPAALRAHPHTPAHPA